MKPYARRFYHSEAWEACRLSYLSKVGNLCERCLKQNIYTLAKIVHHKIYLTEKNICDPNISLNHDNLEAVCQDCHNKEHIKKNKRLRYTFDSNGNVIYPPH